MTSLETSENAKNKEAQSKRLQYERAIEGYLLMRAASENEQHIMLLNRVGQEKDLRSIIQNTARHVGLQMPKGWKDAVKDPFAPEKSTEPEK
jgi:hypothetical protein